MSRAKQIGVGVAAVLGLGLLVSALGSSDGQSKKILQRRIWLDHVPTKDTEHFDAFLAMDNPEAGGFQKASAYEGSYEIFNYKATGNDKLELRFPQTKTKADVTYSAKECNESGFNYCLTLTGSPRGVGKYYSKKGWEIDASSEAELQSKFDAWKQKNLPHDKDED